MDRAPASRSPALDVQPPDAAGHRETIRPAAEATRRRRCAGDDVMLAVAKHFVRDPLGVATRLALAEVGRVLGVHGVAMQNLTATADPVVCCAWHADPDPCPHLARLLAVLPRARLGLEVGRAWRWHGPIGADGLPLAPVGVGDGDTADVGAHAVKTDGSPLPRNGGSRLTARLMALPVLIDGAPVAQVALSLVGSAATASHAGHEGRPTRAWRDDDRRLLAFVVEMYAIALARTRDRRARADTEHRLDSFTRNLPGVVWRRLLLPDGRLRYTYVSSGLKRLADIDPTQAVADPSLLQGVVHPDDRPGVIDSIHVSARLLADWAREFRILTKAGQVRWVHASGKVQRLADGTVAWDGITLDVTDRKRSEQALRESEARFRTAFNQAAEGMGLMSPSGRWLRVNQSLATLLGAPPERIAGTSVARWLAPRDRPVFHDLLRGASAPSGHGLEGEFRVRRPAPAFASASAWAEREAGAPLSRPSHPPDTADPASDADLWIHTKAAPVRDEDGALLYWVAHVQDVSARRATETLLVRARDQAEATARAKSDFVAMMSHEIRTPLSGMIGLARLLQDGSLTTDQARHVGRIEASARLLLTLLEDVLALSKAEAGQGATEAMPFSLASVVSEVLGLLVANAARKGLALAMDLDPTLPARLEGPVLAIRQVLFNLVGNAVKFTPEGAVTVGGWLTWTADDRGVLHLTVADTGPGVRTRERERIFEPFSQGCVATDAPETLDGRDGGDMRGGAGSRTRRPDGVGLGLAICRRLVESAGGTIDVTDATGGGALFRVTVPVRRVAPSPPPEADANEDLDSDAPFSPRIAEVAVAGATRRPHVVVVDDDDINREVIEATLAALDCVPRGFTDGAALLEAARAWPVAPPPPDLILMDVNMPDLDGWATTSRLRALGGAWASVPVLAVTAAGRCCPDTCGEAGISACLSKPVEATTLVGALARWVSGATAVGSGDSVERVVLPAMTRPDAAPPAAAGASVADIGSLPLLDEVLWARRAALLGHPRLADRVRDLRAMCVAAGEADADAPARAHRLAGASATLGATRLAAAARAMERALEQTDAAADAARLTLAAAREATLALLAERLAETP